MSSTQPTPPRAAFDLRQACVLACASDLAYKDPGVIEQTVLGMWKAQDFRYFEVDSTQCFIATTPTDICVSFRGTEATKISDWITDLKPLLPFGRLPVLLDPAGKAIAQSASIVRYIARHNGMAGKSPSDEAAVDMWFEQVKELFGTHQTWGKAFNASALRHATPEELDSASSLHCADRRSNAGLFSLTALPSSAARSVLN